MSISAVSGASSFFSTNSTSSVSSAQEEDEESYIEILMEELEEQHRRTSGRKKGGTTGRTPPKFRAGYRDSVQRSAVLPAFFSFGKIKEEKREKNDGKTLPAVFYVIEPFTKQRRPVIIYFGYAFAYQVPLRRGAVRSFYTSGV